MNPNLNGRPIGHRLRSLFVGLAVMAGTTVGVIAPAGPAGAVGEPFTPLTPARLLDTRPGGVTVDGQSAGGGAIGAGASLTLQVSGRGGVPASGATAVVLNVTAVAPSAGGFTTVYPTGEAIPNASNLNWSAGQVIPNLVVAKLGTGGQISIFNSTGSTHYLVDVMGWSDNTVYSPLSPARLMDTRGAATVDGQGNTGGALGANSSRDLQVSGRGGVPASGVSAVMLNVTAVSPSAGGFTTVYPTGDAQPNASNLNWSAGDVIPNATMVKLGTAGKVTVYNSAGNTHYLVDVVGWFSTAGGFTALSPARLVDSRSGGATVDGLERQTDRLAAQQAAVFQVTGRGGVPSTGVGSVIVNVTAVDPSSNGYATVYPTGETVPNASNLNFVAGKNIPNLVIAKVGAGGKISIFNSGSFTNYIVDVVGWFAGTTPADNTLAATAATEISANGFGACARMADTSVRCWGSNYYTGGAGSWIPVVIPGLAGATSLSNGGSFGCAVVAGAVKCYGAGDSGKLGNGSTAERFTPTAVTTAATATAVAAGTNHACALLSTQAVQCWGANGQGQLGNGSTTNSLTPVSVTGLTGVSALAANANTTCALKTDNTVQCWGVLPSSGSTVTAPTAITGLGTVTKMAVGNGHLCALASDLTVKCLGKNTSGQVGNGSTSALVSSASTVALTGVVDITAGEASSCAVLNTGGVSCWGSNDNGQLGNNTYTNSSSPVSVIDVGVSPNVAVVADAAKVSGGSQSVCIVRTNGAAACWGAGYWSMLGSGNNYGWPRAQRVVGIGPAPLSATSASLTMNSVIGTEDHRDHLAA